MHILSTPIEYLKGVGPIRAELLKSELSIFTYEDLQKNIQSRKEDWYDTLDSPSTLLITVGLFF